MELFRGIKKGKKSRVSTIVHRRHQGDQIVEKPKNLLKLSPNSDLIPSSSVETQEENLCVSSSLPAGTTMKKLLADELKGERESLGRRSPSVIANLMGLDWLPATHNASKQNKRVSNSYEKKCSSNGFGRSGEVNESRSHRNHGKGQAGQQRYKDVYEIAERSNSETGSTTSRAASLMGSREEDEVAFVRQKFIDVKRLSTDEKLRHSKEYHDALEVLDSNKDLVLRFLQEPNSLFMKHLHQLHGARESHCGRVEGMKSLSNLKSNVDVIGSHSGSEVSQKIDISRSRKHFDERPSNLNRRHNVDYQKLHYSAVGKEDSNSLATRIVVLKPNLGKARDSARSVSSTTPSRDFSSDNELRNGYSNMVQLGSGMICKRNKHDPNFCGTKSRESRELAREVTRRMKNKSRVNSFDVPPSGYKGYSADESSGDISENESSYESEETVFDKRMLGSTTSSNRGIHNKASTSASASPHTESTINSEGKKRLSKRWELTHRSQEPGTSGKGSTLAEMLAIPDVDIRPHSPNYVTARDEHLHRRGRDVGTPDLAAPLGISSRDGWKDGGRCNTSRSRSLSTSAIHLGSPKSSSRHEAITAERFLVRSRSMDFGKNKAFHRDSERKHGSFSGSTRCRKKEIQSTSMEITEDRQEIQSGTSPVTDTSIDGKDSPDVKSVILEMSSRKHVPLNEVVDTERDSISTSLNCPDEPVPFTAMQPSVAPQDCLNFDEPSVQQESSSSYYAENPSGLQLSATQPESSASSKESEQPSPVSVLEAPFVEEVSSGSECFEKVSAGLHGLRMQLQLLKQESETYDEGSILISSDESEEESVKPENSMELCGVEESWESSYLTEVLTCSGFEETDINMFLEIWHSPDHPINPSIFDHLEKKYCGWISCSRSERKLLFDRIDAGIFQICSRHVDTEPRVKPLASIFGHQLSKDGLISELRDLIKNDETVNKGNMMEAILRKEHVLEEAILDGMQWFKAGDHAHVGAVGRDVELLLIDELVSEFLSL